MELYLDSANHHEIKEAFTLGIITGLTTTPTFMHKEGIKNIDKVLVQLAEIAPILHIEALGNSLEEICKEVDRIIALGLKKDKTIFKIPVNNEGIKACKKLTQNGFLVNIHLVYTLQQAYMAMLAGATYICPLVGRLQDQGYDALSLMKQCLDMIKKYQSPSKLMFSSVRHIEHIVHALNIGVHACTVPYKIIQKINDNHLTAIGTQQFELHSNLLNKKVKDVMENNKPVISCYATLGQALVKIIQYGLGILIITNNEDKMIGICKDNDLKNYLKKHDNNTKDILQHKISSLAYHDLITLSEETPLLDAVYAFEKHNINHIAVLDHTEKLVGILDSQKLIQKKIIQ